MDFKRKAYAEILAWKNNKYHKPLIVEGMRQVGKSYLVNKFACENYAHVAVFDFRHNTKLRNCFKGNLTVDEIITSASVYFPLNTFVPYQTVLIFEEIGDCDEARTSLKSFSLDGRYDVIATGSLLGVNNYRRKKRLAIPTGYEDYLQLNPMDFEEFLWANQVPDSALNELKNTVSTFNLSPVLQKYFYEMHKRYIVVGGMPEVIQRFLTSNGNYQDARNVQLRLLHDYRGDFGRFIDDDGNEAIDYHLQVQLNQIMDSIPVQLSRENGNYKFKFSEVVHRGRASQFSSAIDWLEKAGLILKVYNTKAIEAPLLANADETSFKVFLSDIGLLMASYPLADLQSFLTDKMGSRKGAVYENLAAIEIYQTGFPLFYYGESEKHLEIDYLLEGMDGIILFEEKSTNGKMAASRMVMEGKTPYHAVQCVKVIDYGFGNGDYYISIPHYLASFYLNSEKERLTSSLVATPLSIDDNLQF